MTFSQLFCLATSANTGLFPEPTNELTINESIFSHHEDLRRKPCQSLVSKGFHLD